MIVQPVAPEHVRRGDLLYYHDGRVGVVHRLQRVRRARRGWEMRTRGDHCVRSDRWRAVETLLMFGRVAAAWRDGRPVRVDAWWQRWWYTSSLQQGWLFLRQRALKPLVHKIQDQPSYLWFARRWGRRVAARMEERRLEHQDRTIVQLRYRGRTIAEVTYHHQTYLLSSIFVRWPYRRLGLARRLTDTVLRLATDKGAPVVRLTVTQGNRPAWRLYERMGFAPVNDGPLPDGATLLERRLETRQSA